ncbi:MAG: hypothetical protein ABJ004_09055 [Cyclobacteriaceae bacterium]
MQLLPVEHEDIDKLLVEQGLTEKVMLVKRKGWLHLEIGDKNFAFHRKQETNLIGGQFCDHYIYYVKAEGETAEFKYWRQVRARLSEWLATIP